jgi:hypothetical protein
MINIELDDAELDTLKYALAAYDRSLTHAISRYNPENGHRNNLANRRRRERELNTKLTSARIETLLDDLVTG